MTSHKVRCFLIDTTELFLKCYSNFTKPLVNFINVKRTNFTYKRLFSSYILALNKLSYKKRLCKTLMKFTTYLTYHVTSKNPKTIKPFTRSRLIQYFFFITCAGTQKVEFQLCFQSSKKELGWLAKNLLRYNFFPFSLFLPIFSPNTFLGLNFIVTSQ